MKKKILLILLLIPLLYIYFYADGELFSELLTGKITSENPIFEEGDIDVYFCPQDNCESVFVNFLDSAEESIHCALFDIGLESVQNKLLEKETEIEVKIITDNQYFKKFNHDFVKADTWGLMHNKFCIIDGKKLSTGSMNPTENGVSKNNNNLLLIESETLTKNYEDEFQEMWIGIFKSGGNVLNPSVFLNQIKIQNYFCPEDHCAARVKEELKKAQESIHFMTFSFTHKGIANILLLKNLDGVLVRGVMEARQVSKYSQFERLELSGIDIIKDGNKNNMHHKVWIINGKTVVTGSFNPSAGGDTRNDENILIIEDEKIAGLFLEEFERIYSTQII